MPTVFPFKSGRYSCVLSAPTRSESAITAIEVSTFDGCGAGTGWLQAENPKSTSKYLMIFVISDNDNGLNAENILRPQIHGFTQIVL
jgi:hypothetical protein